MCSAAFGLFQIVMQNTSGNSTISPKAETLTTYARNASAQLHTTIGDFFEKQELETSVEDLGTLLSRYFESSLKDGDMEINNLVFSTTNLITFLVKLKTAWAVIPDIHSTTKQQ